MNEKELLYRITIDPKIMVGKPTIRGLRITVDQILKALAAGISTDELLEDYPELEKEDIEAALLYAAELVEEEKIYKIGV
ncbi:MAG: DUF433 domain-containing protein [Actinobacteria bacterium]|jgi:uncharacterized protein (DUF433 family)|nr:DUF433 domain-containing protein [Actinomycetota bacterium]